jgi:hypothetical protein
VSPLDRPVPPSGEEIHLPGASVQPVLLAASLTLTLLGVTLGNVVMFAGLIAARDEPPARGPRRALALSGPRW